MNARAMGHRELTVGLWALSHVRQCPAQLTCTLNLRRPLRRTGCLNSNQACLFICLFFFSLDGTGVAIGWIIDSTCSRTQWCSLRLLRCAACACSDVLPAHAHLLVIFSRHACFLFRDRVWYDQGVSQFDLEMFSLTMSIWSFCLSRTATIGVCPLV